VQPWQAPASQVQALPGGGFTIQGRAQGAAPGQGALQGEMLRRLRQMLRGPEGRAALEGLLRAFGGTPTSAPPSVHVKKHVKLEKAESER
jgi:surface antigen